MEITNYLKRLGMLAVSGLLLAPHAPAAILYVNANNPAPVAAYTDWSIAATNIQDAIDAAADGDTVLVTNGVYQFGGYAVYAGMTNRVAVTKALAVKSVNGPLFTSIVGNQMPGTTNGATAVRCVYLANGASISGFTLTNGSTTGTSPADEPYDITAGGGLFCGPNGGTATDCIIVGNYSPVGGGAARGTLVGCAIHGNSAEYGGGVTESSLYNCTVVGNSASTGGGVYSASLYNCIDYFNNAPISPNYESGSPMVYCCTTPLPTNGSLNFIADPQLADLSHISAGSPCRGTGNPVYALSTDIDSEAWLSPPSIGCDEFHSGFATNVLSAAFSASYTNVGVGFAVNFTSLINGQPNASTWNFGDGTVVSNEPYASHDWSAPGSYQVILTAFNDAHPAGVAATQAVHVVQEIHYVSATGVSPVAPYTSWATAATSIQDAVGAAIVPGALVLVSNGVYQAGVWMVNGAGNRVAVTNPLIVSSVNGPAVTTIVGYQVPSNTTGGTPVRCVYLCGGAVLSGFTLSNGGAQSGDLVEGQSGGGVLGASTNAVVSNCVFAGNLAYFYGGGAYGVTLQNCTLSGNHANNGGGGASASTLNNCKVVGNSADDFGGGTANSTLNDCSIVSNNCDLHGGGVWRSVLNNCSVTGNSVAGVGGGAFQSILNNCTVVNNSATTSGGGAAYSTMLNNCIDYFNNAPDGANADASCILNYCCTTPLPPGGFGTVTADPQLASPSHLSANSPCRGAGSSYYVTGVDIDGETWLNPPSIGCDEFHSGSATGKLNVAFTVLSTSVAAGFADTFASLIDGQTSSSFWNFGDGSAVTNEPFVTHAWTSPGSYSVILRAFNDAYPGGISATTVVQVVAQPVHYVALNSLAPAAPYSSWATAATNIQDAVDAASVSGALVLVSNGVYRTGGRVVYGALTNRVAVTKPLIVSSLTGPEFTTIMGYQEPGITNSDSAVRCAYVTNGAVLMGFTLTNGATRTAGDNLKENSGGAVWSELSGMVSNCVIAGNASSVWGGGAIGGDLVSCAIHENSTPYDGGGAYYCSLSHCALSGNAAFYGGGAASYSVLNQCVVNANSTGINGGGAEGSTLNNCLISDNTAKGNGGGAYESTLNNCTIAGNSASSGGGAYESQLNNCIVLNNSANFDSYCTLTYCCTSPLPNGPGNFIANPLFVNPAGGDYRLQAGSPCINAGNNANAVGTTDLDGRPRIVGGAVDIGAYEYQGQTLEAFIEWLQQFGLPTDGSADYADTDHDGMNNYQEWRAGTDPTNSLSVLKLLTPSATGARVTLTWQSVPTRSYYVLRSTNLGAAGSFSLLATNIPGLSGATSYTDTNAPLPGPAFYRVGVQ
jgi:PKD repeat protein